MCFVMVFIHVFNPAAIINKHKVLNMIVKKSEWWLVVFEAKKKNSN